MWELWDETWDAGNFRGMDGDPVGRHFCCVESAARALGVPWDRKTFRKYRLILNVWMSKVADELKKRNEGRRRKR